jgi:hypothetical protein
VKQRGVELDVAVPDVVSVEIPNGVGALHKEVPAFGSAEDAVRDDVVRKSVPHHNGCGVAREDDLVEFRDVRTAHGPRSNRKCK